MPCDVQSCNDSFVPRNERFHISINSSYSSFVVGLLRRTDWALEGRR